MNIITTQHASVRTDRPMCVYICVHSSGLGNTGITFLFWTQCGLLFQSFSLINMDCMDCKKYAYSYTVRNERKQFTLLHFITNLPVPISGICGCQDAVLVKPLFGYTYTCASCTDDVDVGCTNLPIGRLQVTQLAHTCLYERAFDVDCRDINMGSPRSGGVVCHGINAHRIAIQWLFKMLI